MHFGIAKYVDKPIELWQTLTWGSLIRAILSNFVVSIYLKFLFPRDFV